MLSSTMKRPLAALGVVAGLLAAAVPAGAAGLSASQSPNGISAGAATAHAQGIIMKDGNICDPIRHMGC